MSSVFLLPYFLVSVLFIVTLGLCLGALFPSFETDDPEIISTSLSGLAFTLLSLSFATLASYVLYLFLPGKISLVFASGCLLATVALALLIALFTMNYTKNGIRR